MERIRFAMVADSFRADRTIETGTPAARGASLRFGLRLVRRGRGRNGRTQGRGGSRFTEIRNAHLNARQLLHRSTNSLKLSLKTGELARDLAEIVGRADRRHSVLGKQCGHERIGVTPNCDGNTFVD